MGAVSSRGVGVIRESESMRAESNAGSNYVPSNDSMVSSSKIIHEILLSQGSAGRTQKEGRQCKRANMYAQKYLEFCVRNGLLRKTSGGYVLTPKGEEFIEFLDRASSLKNDILRGHLGFPPLSTIER